MGTPTTLKFDVKIQNNNADYIIAALAAGNKNYAVTFYFSKSDVSNNVIAATAVAMTITGTSPGLEFGLAVGASSASLIFQTSATLPTAACATYTHVCACVSKGADALYTETPTNNNCGCKAVGTTISCAGKYGA
jgi:hypothetical protein